MDTGSHLLFGASLAGLAFLDPAVAGQPELAHAVLVAALAGSHAPDLDTVTRFISYNHYIRYHRGITHSLPAIFLWPAVIALPISLLFGVASSFAHLYFWTMLAVFFHILLDLFNAYGVQCLRPFSQRWLHLDILALFDPFMFVLHGTGLVMWAIGAAPPVPLFPILYGTTLIYLFIRVLHHGAIIRKVWRKFPSEKRNCHVVPGLRWSKWQFVLETEECFYTGKIDYGVIIVRDIYRKGREHPAARATLGTDGVRAFLHFAQRVHANILEVQDGYQVEWRDMRFWYDHKLPFGVDVRLDRDMKVIREQLGWSKKAWDPPYV